MTYYQFTNNDFTAEGDEYFLVNHITYSAGEGKIITSKSEPYKEVLKNLKIKKLGYICEQKGIEYPIYLRFSNSNNYQSYFVSNEDCVFEFEDAEIFVTGVKVPVGISFKIDYLI